MTPNVSVIIRTIGRPSLHRAIESVERQNRTDVEIVIVAAEPDLAPVRSDICPIRWLPTEMPLHRSAAANAGLEAARGQYLIFLDDDDWFEAAHLDKLIAALDKHPDAAVAYTGVRMESEAGEHLAEFDSPFEPWQLMAGNHFPLHAALFRRSAVTAAQCRFDERFDVYEDWDFWLQLQKVGPFVHVPGVSAVYLHSATGSGAHALSYGDEPYRKLWRKWGGLYDSSWLASLFEHVNQLPGMQHQLDATRAELDARRAELDATRAELDARRAELRQLASELATVQDREQSLRAELERVAGDLNAVLNSRSWKLTAGPRRLVKAFRAWRSGGLPELKRALRRDRPVADNPDAWPEYHRTFNRVVKPRIVRRIREIPSRPLISIIVPVYDTPENMLREMLESVRGQLYPEWELCVADDGSSQPNVKMILQAYAAKDRRIKLHLALKNRGVSHASNRALEMATGEFVVLLDHDDILEEQALFRVAESILEENPDMVYSDEVLVTPDLARVRRYAYRPAFSPEFLRAHPYIVHLVGFRTQLLRDLGGFDEDLSISQDYDLILRVTEKARTIVHIPELLYQWRLHGNSAGEQKMREVTETSKAVLRRHLERCGETGIVNDGAGFNLFDVRYPLGDDLNVAIIIPTKNHGDLVRQCIDSIRATVLAARYDIVVIDHESDDPDTLAYLSINSPGVKVLRYEGVFNFSAINNWAISRLDGRYSHYLFCNNDIEAIKPGWLERMLELGQHPSVGIVGAKLLYPDRKTIQHAGVCVGAYGCAEHYGKFLNLSENPGEAGFLEVVTSTHEVAAVTAACLLIRKEAFDQIAGFDEALAVGFGDVDLCLRAGECGYRTLYCPHAELLHHESYTRGKSRQDPHPKDSALFRSKWRKELQAGDVYFNPGLSLASTSWHTKDPLNCGFDIKRRIFERDTASGRQKLTHSQSRRRPP